MSKNMYFIYILIIPRFYFKFLNLIKMKIFYLLLLIQSIGIISAAHDRH